MHSARRRTTVIVRSRAPRQRVRFLLLAVALSAIVVLAGCGSGSSSSSSTTASSGGGGEATTASAPQGTPIKIGVVYTSGSPIQNSVNVYAADKAAIQALNERGGLNGQPVELVACDDKGDPNQTESCGRKLVSEEVAAVAGGILINGATLNPILAAAKIPQIGIVPYTPVEFNAKNVFLFNGGGFFGSEALAAYLGQQKLTTSLVTAQGAAAEGFKAAMEGSIAAAGGKFTNIVPVSATQSDWAPIVAAATSNNANSVMDLVDTEQTKQLLAANEQAGAPIEHIFTVSNFTTEDSAEIGGEGALERIVTGGSYPPFDSKVPAMEEFTEQMTAEFEAGETEARIGRQDLGSFGGWLAVKALETLAEQGELAKEVTAATVTKALDSAKNVELGGATPPWTPSAPGPEGFARVANEKTYLIGFKGGEQFLIAPQPLTVEEIIAGKAPAPPGS
jgi:ABC-type branched-subunit amino acid transport system substrate-binding protein